MIKKHLLLLFCIIVCSSSFNNNAQSIKPKKLLKKTDIALKNIQTVVYKIEHDYKHFSSRDTIKRIALCSLFLDFEDKMNAYHILDVKFSQTKKYGHYQYDGIYTSALTYHTDSTDVEIDHLIETVVENNYSSIMGTHVNNYLLQDYFKKKNIFRQSKSFLAKFLIKKMKVEETVYLDEPVYLLTIYVKNIKLSNYVQNVINKYYIRKKDFLPVAYSFYGEFEGMKEYEYYKIEYLEINPDIPLKEFKVDINLTKISPKSIYKRVKKYGL
ncbi:MAG: hypothetical protein PHC38_09510 [Weeksellaceae bacterium]|nr:hypothetical protein [Weeksellaceae bacterium]